MSHVGSDPTYDIGSMSNVGSDPKAVLGRKTSIGLVWARGQMQRFGRKTSCNCYTVTRLRVPSNSALIALTCFESMIYLFGTELGIWRGMRRFLLALAF